MLFQIPLRMFQALRGAHLRFRIRVRRFDMLVVLFSKRPSTAVAEPDLALDVGPTKKQKNERQAIPAHRESPGSSPSMICKDSGTGGCPEDLTGVKLRVAVQENMSIMMTLSYQGILHTEMMKIALRREPASIEILSKGSMPVSERLSYIDNVPEDRGR